MTNKSNNSIIRIKENYLNNGFKMKRYMLKNVSAIPENAEKPIFVPAVFKIYFLHRYNSYSVRYTTSHDA